MMPEGVERSWSGPEPEPRKERSLGGQVRGLALVAGLAGMEGTAVECFRSHSRICCQDLSLTALWIGMIDETLSASDSGDVFGVLWFLRSTAWKNCASEG